MPNTNAPFGLRPIRYISGAPYNGAVNKYHVTAANAAGNMFVGDPVVLAGSSVNGVPTITLATVGASVTTDLITGVIVGFEPDESYQTQYRAASTARNVLVADDPNLLFLMQEDATGGKIGADSVGGTIQIASGTGSTVTGLSGYRVDSSEPGTTATDQLRLLGLLETDTSYQLALVRINMHTHNAPLTGI